MKCSACGKDRLDKAAYEEAKRILKERGGGLKVNMMNPGGRELVAQTGVRIMLSDMCNGCDLQEIRRKLEEIL